MKDVIRGAVGAAFLCATAAYAQQAPLVSSAQQVLTVQKANIGSSLASNTEVWLSMNGGLNSKQAKTGDKFDLTVSRDVMMGEYVVIPRGTPAHGQISYRTGKGAFGKSAKMEFDLVDVQVGDRFIPVSGHYRIEGNGNTGATVGAVVAVGVFAVFVTGHSATAAQGSEWKAYTKEPILLAVAPTAPAAPATQNVAVQTAATSNAMIVPINATVAQVAK